jgi:hypothetical protein
MRARVILVTSLTILLGQSLAARAEALGPSVNERLRAEIEATRLSGGKVGEKACLCRNTVTAMCLNCRFGIAAQWQNPFNGASGTAGEVPLTGESGYFWFDDPFNMEIPIKILDGCGSAPPTQSWWVFAAGLTDLGITLVILDWESGITKVYTNPPGQVFNTIIDQQTPWPCL